jgi:alanine racemase
MPSMSDIMATTAEDAGSVTACDAVLTIDLRAIQENYLFLRRTLAGKPCAAVVKANAYGLGAERVAPALERVGCSHFFVAHLNEALALRPRLAATSSLFVLNGLPPGSEGLAAAHGIVPVLNSLPHILAWSELASRLGQRLPAVLQVDSGMSRLGLSAAEIDALEAKPELLSAIETQLVMSHLACADEPDHPANRMQLDSFNSLRRRLPAAPASFANSAGILLGSAYHADLGRPGVALYGAHPGADRSAPLRPTLRLEAKIVQTRTIAAGVGVGYGHIYVAQQPMRLATIAVGYADGWMRSLSGRGRAFFAGQPLPIIGRVSMDSMTLDISAVPEGALRHGTMVELIGPHQTVDDVAAHAGTIGYEILTSLGGRYARQYVNEDAGEAARSLRAPGGTERMEQSR